MTTTQRIPSAPPVLTDRQKKAVRIVLLRIASWTHARFDQHLRDIAGDDDTNQILEWLKIHVGKLNGEGLKRDHDDYYLEDP